MIIVVTFYVVVALFFAKIAWNLYVPYALLLRSNNESRGGVSFHPHVEVSLLVLAIVVSLWTEFASPWNAKGIAVFGSTIVIVSYLHLICFGRIVIWLRRMKITRD